MGPTAGYKINYIFIVSKTVGGGGGGAVQSPGGGWIIYPRIISTQLGGVLKISNFIRSGLGLEIYSLFHKEPVPVYFENRAYRW